MCQDVLCLSARTISSSSQSSAHRPLCSCDAIPLGVWGGVGWQEVSDLLYLRYQKGWWICTCQCKSTSSTACMWLNQWFCFAKGKLQQWQHLQSGVFLHSTGKKTVKDGSASTAAWSFTSTALHEKRFCLKQTSCFFVLFKVELEKELCYSLNVTLM